MKHQVPKFLSKYFWDTGIEGIDLQRDKKQIAERILNFGDQKAINWLMFNYPLSFLKKVIKSTRSWFYFFINRPFGLKWRV